VILLNEKRVQILTVQLKQYLQAFKTYYSEAFSIWEAFNVDSIEEGSTVAFKELFAQNWG